MKKKFLSFLLTLVLLFSALAVTACDTDANPEELDQTKTHLYVVTYDGGWGKAWLETMAREFEQMYAGHSFEDGRQGVIIHIKGGKNDVTGDAVKSLMSTSNYDVYFTTYRLREYVLEDRLMDITDVVNNTMDAKYDKVWKDLGETKTIAEKMDGAIKDYILYATADSKGNVDTANPKYYGIPMYSSFYNINYDIDLFYEKGYYLKEDGNFCGRTKGSGKVTEDVIDGQKSLGQDGIKGTKDDGLPITFADFQKVCAKMVRDGVSPICWSGNLDSYRIGYFNNFHANYEGAEEWYINVTGEGVDPDVFNGEMTVEARNGWNTAKQRGRLAALSFAELIMKNGWWDSDATNGTDHYGSQDKFLMSKKNSEKGGKRIAMFIEGGWWENEAKATIETMANQYGGEYVNRRFGVMTYPRFDDGHYTETRYLDEATGNYTVKEDNGKASRQVNDMTIVSVTPDSNVAIRKNAKQPEAAKLFLAYTTTDKCLRTYTRMTGSTRPYDYELTEDDFAEMSEFKQQLWGYYSRAIKAGNVRYISGPGRFGELNPQIVTGTYGVASWGVVVNEINVNMLEPLRIFQTYGAQDGFTAQAYFDAYVAYYTADNGAVWKAKFCKNL